MRKKSRKTLFRFWSFFLVSLATDGKKHSIKCKNSAKWSIFGTKKGELGPKNAKYGTLHDFACHPCAGAMLIFSVSFQF